MAHIEKRGKSYRIRASVGYRVNGSQVQPSMTWTPDPGMTSKQIEKELNRQTVLFEEQCAKNAEAAGHMKFENYAKRWLTEVAPSYLAPRTIENYKGLQARAYKHLGHLYVDKIRPINIQKFVSSLYSEIGQRTKRPLSQKTVKNYIGFVSTVFSYAVKVGDISESPCTSKKISLRKSTPTEKKCYTLEESQFFISDLIPKMPLKYQAFFLLALFGGFRREELCGLEWMPDIDFDHCIIHINRVSLYTKDQGIFTSVPKTNKSRRANKLPGYVFSVLHRLRAEQLEQRLSMGDQWVESGRVFTATNGSPIFPSLPYQWLQRFCRDHDFPFYGIHSFRHLNASLLINEGIDVRTVSASLGHSQPSTTLNIYAHAFASAQAIASEAISNKLLPKSKKLG